MLALIDKLMPGNSSKLVVRTHGFAPQFLAIDASKALVKMFLQAGIPRTAARPRVRRSERRRPAGPEGRSRSTNLAGRDPTGGGLQQVAAVDETATVAAIKAAFQGLTDLNHWPGNKVGKGGGLEGHRSRVHEGGSDISMARARRRRHGHSTRTATSWPSRTRRTS